MARSADFDLARELARPGFTPGARDAEALAQLIIDGNEPAATRAAPALAGLCEPGRTVAVVRIADSTLDDGARARLAAVLGLLARSGDNVARGQLLVLVTEATPRIRRAAAVALGKLTGEVDDARAALLARWDAGDAAPDERRALAEALGKLGGDAALARLRALDAGDDAELVRRRDRAVLMADRSARRDAASIVVGDVAPPAPITIQLGCRPGLGGLLCEELAALGEAPQRIGDRGAKLRWAAPLARLFESRLWATLAIPFALPAVRGAEQLGAAITQTMTSAPVRALLRAWTTGPIRWRLGFASGHKRAVVWQVARDVTAAAPELINDPTATTWDAIVDDAARTLSLIPRRLDDPRFAYRTADVPAASHPTVAAALAWLAEPRDGERVWDPFCGSGLELIETAHRAQVRALGSDLDDAALDAARANLTSARVTAELVNGDALRLARGPFDLIISNPPLGSRVQVDAAALLIAALPNFVRALAPGGRLVWITPAARRTGPVAAQLGLVRGDALPVDLGGVRGQLERWDRA